jgi:DNA polymerase III delta prime subunit
MYFKKIHKNQENVYDFFSKALEKSKLSRAYLLCGGANIIKLDLIKELNKTLNCQLNLKDSLKNSTSSIFRPGDKTEFDSRSGSLSFFSDAFSENQMINSDFQGVLNKTSGTIVASCGKCMNCKWIEDDNHPKTPIIIESENKKKFISIEQIKNLQNELSQVCDYFRIIVIKDASRMGLNPYSSAALLKTIEEARPNTMFILLAPNRENVLQTISSRSQTLYFNGFDKEVPSEKVLELYAQLQDKLKDGSLDDLLNKILLAETLAENEVVDLIEMLEYWQNQLGESLQEADAENQKLKSAQIIKIEQAILDLKSYVREKAVLVGVL